MSSLIEHQTAHFSRKGVLSDGPRSLARRRSPLPAATTGELSRDVPDAETMSLDRPFGATSDDAQPPERKFTVRFNRRGSRRRGLLFYRLLEQAALTDPVTYAA